MMIERFAERIVEWQIRNHFLESKDRVLYQYAYGLLIGQAINLLISCLLAVVFRAYVFVAVYLISYIPLRSFAGGHHAASYGICTIISTGILALACTASKLIPEHAFLYVNIAVTAAGTYMMLRYAPVEAANKPLEPDERKRYRKRSIQIWAAEVCLWILFYACGRKEISFAIGLAQATLICLLGVGKFVFIKRLAQTNLSK